MVVEVEIGDGLIRHYSDMHMMILQAETSTMYSDAIDVMPCLYTYTETDIPIDDSKTEEAITYLANSVKSINETQRETSDALADLSEVVSDQGESQEITDTGLAELSEIVSRLVPQS